MICKQILLFPGGDVVIFQQVSEHNRSKVNSFITEHWFSTDMIIRGEIVDLAAAEGFFVEQEDRIAALITYIISGYTLEITSLNSLAQRKGTGSALVEKAVETAKQHGCGRVIVVTTNDNTSAMRFYQKRGFDMARIYHNSLERARQLKPSIPLTGENGIPLMHEIEFEMKL